ncbi:hypothetical protein ABZ904_25715 [Streptomyces sp. NPDC046900]|uniref:hypothetical protein n=1 Tax=Streptomyces sp. NPDC046900 TaxID=3155473 RepID=UPI0034088F2C
MTDPTDPVLLFDEDGRMFILHEPALADELLESADEFLEGYDGLGRPVCAYGEPGHVALALASTEAQGDEVRARVERYYDVFAARHPTRVPPQEADLSNFIRAVAEDWVEE